MKQYKLIKKYPGLPENWEEGMILKINDNFLYYIPCDGKYSKVHIYKSMIENYPEFWQLIKEKDYEILSFVCLIHGTPSAQIFIKKNNDLYTWLNVTYTFNDLINNKSYAIHSIKRLSDEEKFIIGDKVKTFNLITSIKSFRILQNNELAIDFDNNISTTNANNLYKAKQPLFTTEDGVDIYEGDTSYGVRKTDFQIIPVTHHNSMYVYKNFLEFSTKEKAEEYVLMNKPCLSINNVIDVLKKPGYSGLVELLKELVKTKI